MENTHFRQTAIFKKALDIFKVSRGIACSISDNKHILEIQHSGNSTEQVAGEIVSDSLRLVPELAAVHNSTNSTLQIRRAKKLRKAARHILAKCSVIEYQAVKERDIILLLKNELQQFDQLFSEWLYNLKLKGGNN